MSNYLLRLQCGFTSATEKASAVPRSAECHIVSLNAQINEKVYNSQCRMGFVMIKANLMQNYKMTSICSSTRAAAQTSSPTSNARSRRSHTKSRHGCLGCKQRRKKVNSLSNKHQLPQVSNSCSAMSKDLNVQDVLIKTSPANTLVLQNLEL